MLEQLARVTLHFFDRGGLVYLILNWHVNFAHRVRQTQVAEQFEVDEFKECHVKLGERSHHLVVDIEGHPLVELVWLDPCDRLAHDFNAVVDSLDREKALRKALRDGAVHHEIAVKSLTLLDLGLRYVKGQMLWQLRVKRDKAEGVVKVAKCIYERRVPVLNDWCQVVLGSFLDVLLCSLEFPAAQIFFVFL